MEELFDDQVFALSDSAQGGGGDDIASELAAVLDSERKRADTLASLRDGLSPMPNGREWAPPEPGNQTIGTGADGELPEGGKRPVGVGLEAMLRGVGGAVCQSGRVSADVRQGGAPSAQRVGSTAAGHPVASAGGGVAAKRRRLGGAVFAGGAVGVAGAAARCVAGVSGAAAGRAGGGGGDVRVDIAGARTAGGIRAQLR
eukprot:ctg_174.g124